MTESPAAAIRVSGYDLARALAVIGMVLVNYKVVMAMHTTEPAWLRMLVGAVEGRAVAIFVVLAGVGLSLLSRRSRLAADPIQIARDRQTILKRALFLFIIGLLYSPLWPADILHFYGLYLALGAWLLTASSWRLWLTAMSLVCGWVLLLLIFDYNAGWNWQTLDYTDFWSPQGMVRHLFFNGFHPVFPWAALLVVGMWLGRLDVTRKSLRRRLLAATAVVALVTEALSALASRAAAAALEPALFAELGPLLATDPIPPTPQYIVASGATAVAVILLSIEATEAVGDSAWLRPLIATGQLALTLYIAHVVVGMGALGAVGRLYNQSLPFAVGAALVFSITAVLCAWLWRQRLGRGPVEWVMRRLTS